MKNYWRYVLKIKLRNKILSEYQAGFRSKNSCETALQSVLLTWKGALEEEKMVGVVFLDFKRAFETINRQLLLLKMGKYGFGKVILKWFGEYLSERTQVTKYGSVSKSLESVHGVPQGTVLGPILFILYINDIVKIIKNCKIQLFADDTIIYVTGDKVDDITQTLNNELDNLFKWLNNNYLKLNVTKTKMMIIKNRNRNLDIVDNVKIGGENIDRVVQFKYLGCVIDQHLTFSEHFQYITNKVAKKVNILSRMSGHLSSWTKLTVYKTIVAPHFYFCSTLLFLMNNTELDILQKKQNRALRIILACNRYTRISNMLELTNLLSVRQTVIYNSLIFIYKMVNHMLPEHLLNSCRFVRDVHAHNTRSNDCFYLDRVSSSFSQNSLFYKGLKYYNDLPKNVKNSNNLINFKKSCKLYIKEKFHI